VTVREPLLRRLVLLVAGVVATLSVGAFVITASVTRSGLEELFRQRFDRAARVLQEHASSRQVARQTELESVLTSPRFLAAVETADPATIADAVPTHVVLSEAEIVVVMDPEGGALYPSGELGDEIVARLADASRTPGPVTMSWARGAEVFDILATPLVANNGMRLGMLAVGNRIDRAYAEELQALTGFEVIVTRGSDVVARTRGLVPAEAQFVAARDLPVERVEELEFDRDHTMVYRASDRSTGLTVTFVGSVDDAIAPIMAHVRRLLLALALAGALLAVGLGHLFAKHRVVRPVESLARSAERIARGDLDFSIRSESNDELGYVAGEFEKMRSQLRANRDALEAAHAERVHSERLATLGRMAAGIIHDFKNPMGVVLGTADLIRARDPENPKLARQCDVISAQIERMSALTRDVLEYARGRSVLEPSTLDLRAWLREIADGHEDSYRRGGVKLVVNDGAAASATIDPGRMRRVFDNLLANAREASRVGDTVTVSLLANAEGGFVVEVRDEGAGIPEDIRPTLFEPFVTAGKDGGSGLGLAIAKKIVEDHGATIGVESEPGKGARFRVVLPAKLVVQAPTAREEVVTS
jgi:signal transduction histidine kinase